MPWPTLSDAETICTKAIVPVNRCQEFGLELRRVGVSGMGETMDNRKGDKEQRSRFRSNRFFKNDGKWYFSTREGTIEGPFWDQKEAENKLADYIKIMDSGFMPKNSTLELTPLDKKK